MRSRLFALAGLVAATLHGCSDDSVNGAVARDQGGAGAGGQVGTGGAGQAGGGATAQAGNAGSGAVGQAGTGAAGVAGGGVTGGSGGSLGGGAGGGGSGGTQAGGGSGGAGGPAFDGTGHYVFAPKITYQMGSTPAAEAPFPLRIDITKSNDTFQARVASRWQGALDAKSTLSGESLEIQPAGVWGGPLTVTLSPFPSGPTIPALLNGSVLWKQACFQTSPSLQKGTGVGELVPDTFPPEVRVAVDYYDGPAAPDGALPWQQLTLEASEPIGAPSLESLATLPAGAGGTTKGPSPHQLVSFHLADWNTKTATVTVAGGLTDLSGNVAPASVASIAIAPVPPPTPVIDLAASASGVYFWGGTYLAAGTPDAASCESGGCLRFFAGCGNLSFCEPGRTGLAARLPASSANVVVRLRTVVGGDAFSPPHLIATVAVPGGVATDHGTVLPAGDSGYHDLVLPVPPGATEVGLFVGAAQVCHESFELFVESIHVE